jgi:small subunit ribosomal protein S2
VKSFKSLIINLIESGIHIGGPKTQSNAFLGDNLQGTRYNITLFNLTKTVLLLKHVVILIKSLGLTKSKFLFINYDIATKDISYYYAQLINQVFLLNKWVGGFLTNYKEIMGRLKWPVINDFDMLVSKPLDFDKKRSKIKFLQFKKDLASFERNLYPKALFILNLTKNEWALNEGNHLNIPIISVLNNSTKNINLIQYGIGGNDKTLISVNLFNRIIVDAYNQGLFLRYLKIVKFKIQKFYLNYKLLLKLYTLIFINYRLLLFIVTNLIIYKNDNNIIISDKFIFNSLKLIFLLINQINSFIKKNKLNKISKILIGTLLKKLLKQLNILNKLVINILISYYLTTSKTNIYNLVLIYNNFIKIKLLLNKRFYYFNTFDYYLYQGIRNFYK